MPPPWPIPRLPRLRRPDGAALRRNGTNPPAAAAPDPDLVTVLEAVTSLCDRVVDALESDRAERAALVDALTRLATALEENRTGPRPELPGERVLGGTIGPITAPAVNGADSPPSPAGIPPTPVEVRSGLEGRWVEGFEVCDTVRDAHGIRYRLRRLVDRVVLPELFAEEDVRRSIRSAEGTGTTPPRVRRWSPF